MVSASNIISYKFINSKFLHDVWVITVASVVVAIVVDDVVAMLVAVSSFLNFFINLVHCCVFSKKM